MMDELENLAAELAEQVCGASLHQLEEHREREKLVHLFHVSNLVRYYRLGRNPERWLGRNPDVILARKLAGLPGDLEEQKQILRAKGLFDK